MVKLVATPEGLGVIWTPTLAETWRACLSPSLNYNISWLLQPLCEKEKKKKIPALSKKQTVQRREIQCRV